MSDFKRLLKNSSYLVISDQIAHLIGIAQVVIIVRYLGATNYGVWSTAQSFPGMFVVLMDLGLNSIMLRSIAKNRQQEQRLVQQVFVLKLVLMLVFLTFISIILKVFNYESDVRVLAFLASVAYVLASFSEIFVAANRAKENFRFESILNVSKTLLVTSLSIAVVLMGLGIRGLVFSLLFSNTCILIVCLYLYRNTFLGYWFGVARISEYLNLIRNGLPFAFHNIVSPVFLQIDIIMLSKLSTFESVGLYSAAFRIITALYFIPAALNRTLFPGLSRLHGKSQSDFEDLYRKSCRLAGFLGMPAALALFVLSDKIVKLFFSSTYLTAAVPLQIFGLSIAFYYLRLVFSAVMYESGHEKAAVTIFAISTILNITLDYFLIPVYSCDGAAMAALISEILLFFAYYLFLRWKVVNAGNLLMVVKICSAALIMATVLFFTRATFLGVQIGLGLAVYLLCCFLFKILNNEDLAMIRGLYFRLRMRFGRANA